MLLSRDQSGGAQAATSGLSLIVRELELPAEHGAGPVRRERAARAVPAARVRRRVPLRRSPPARGSGLGPAGRGGGGLGRRRGAVHVPGAGRGGAAGEEGHRAGGWHRAGGHRGNTAGGAGDPHRPGARLGLPPRQRAGQPAGGAARRGGGVRAGLGRGPAPLRRGRLRPGPGGGHRLPGGDLPGPAGDAGAPELGARRGAAGLPAALRAGPGLPGRAGAALRRGAGPLPRPEGRSRLPGCEAPRRARRAGPVTAGTAPVGVLKGQVVAPLEGTAPARLCSSSPSLGGLRQQGEFWECWFVPRRFKAAGLLPDPGGSSGKYGVRRSSSFERRVFIHLFRTPGGCVYVM